MRYFVFIIILFSLSFANVSAQPYVFAYFSNEPGLHLAYSEDAENWTEIKMPTQLLLPDEDNSRKCFRDPCLYNGHDGTFHLVWTVGYPDSFGYSSSKDLIHWSQQKRIRIMQNISTTKNVWAPEIVYDKKSELYYIIWSSTVEYIRNPDSDKTNDKGWDHRIYFTTTRDFETFAEPKLYFDPDYTVIDAAITEGKHGKYMMLIKDERRYPVEKNIRVTFTRDLASGFPTKLSGPLTDNKVAWAEGPAPLHVGKYVYVFFDKYSKGSYGAIRSRRGKIWEDISDRCSFPKGMRHGSAIAVNREVLNRLLEFANK